MHSETELKKAIRIKGYGSDKELNLNSKSKLERVKKVDKDLFVKPTVISSLVEYIKFVDKLNSDYKRPVFYRGQGNANFLINPNSLRINPENERNLIEAFSRKFSHEIESCSSNMARLVLMQHFGLSTRALDISESPLAALYFACSPMKKFCKNRNEELSNWGEIVLFRDPDEEKADNSKPVHSNTVSLLASTAFMENVFSLWELGMEWKNDNNLMRNEECINIRDILQSSVIVRVPQDNQRIKNQNGAFIIVNANRIFSLSDAEEEADELTDYILSRDLITFEDLMEDRHWCKKFDNGKTWELGFTKINPYSKNKNEVFDTDPFNLRRLFYKDKHDIQQVVLIPPECKEDIVKQLRKFNISEDFIYPDMDNVAHEINDNMNK